MTDTSSRRRAANPRAASQTITAITAPNSTEPQNAAPRTREAKPPPAASSGASITSAVTPPPAKAATISPDTSVSGATGANSISINRKSGMWSGSIGSPLAAPSRAAARPAVIGAALVTCGAPASAASAAAMPAGPSGAITRTMA
jgi:hypothetical protein